MWLLTSADSNIHAVICTDGAYAFFASCVRHFLLNQLSLGSLPKYNSGFIYISLGLSLALLDRKP